MPVTRRQLAEGPMRVAKNRIQGCSHHRGVAREAQPQRRGCALLAVPRLGQQPIDVAPELFARGAFFLGQLG